MKKPLLFAVIFLAGCSTEASRMQACLDKGVSRDACYIGESNRKAALDGAVWNSLYNDPNRYRDKHDAKQHAQAAKKERVYKSKDVRVVIRPDGMITVNEHLAALDETTPKAKAYSQGLYTVIVYNTGKVALMENGVFVEYMKKQ